LFFVADLKGPLSFALIASIQSFMNSINAAALATAESNLPLGFINSASNACYTLLSSAKCIAMGVQLLHFLLHFSVVNHDYAVGAGNGFWAMVIRVMV
jgi:hypothetical protein